MNRVIRFRTRPIWLMQVGLTVVCLVASPLAAVEIKGKVTKADDKVVHITTNSELLPNVGDTIEIYFEIPGLEEPVNVGAGKVTEVYPEELVATINDAKTKLTRNQLARITSENPRHRGDVSPKSSSPKQPTKPLPADPKHPGPNTPSHDKVGLLQTLTGRQSTIYGLAFSDDGHQAMAFADGYEEWDVQSGKPGRNMPIGAGAISAVFNPGHQLMLTGEKTGLARLWDLKTGNELRQFKGHESPIADVTLSPDGNLAASCAGKIEMKGPVPVDCTIRVWETNTGRELYCLRGHKAPVLAVGFTPFEKFLLSAGSDKSIRVWEMEKGTETERYLEFGPLAVTAVAFAPFEKVFVTLSAGPPAILQEREPFPKNAATNQGSEAKEVHTLSEFQNEGRDSFRFRLWDATTGKVLKLFKGHRSEVYCAAFSPDGHRLLSGSADRSVRLWDVKSGRELAHFEEHDDSVWRVAFSGDGRRALSGDMRGTVRVWQLPADSEEDSNP